MEEGKDEPYNQVCHYLFLIGVRVETLPEDLIHKYSEVDWTTLEEMGGGFIAFEYCFGGKGAWQMVKEGLPKLQKALKSMLKEPDVPAEDLPQVPKRKKVRSEFDDDEAEDTEDKPPLKSKEILKILRKHKKELQQQYGVAKLMLFSPYSRDEAAPGNYVDMLTELDKEFQEESEEDSSYYGGVYYHVHVVQDYLKHLLGTDVDLMPYDGLEPEELSRVKEELIEI